MARSARSKIPSGFRRLWSDHVSLVGVVVALLGAALATVVGRATGAGWLPAIGLALLLGVGLYLWARDKDKGWGDLGEGIMVSVIVAIALMAVQRDADDRTRSASERRDRQLRDADVRRERQLREAEATRQAATERENLQLSLTMQTDLRGIALADRDMNSFFLANKNLANADLHGANLAAADLRASRLVGANLLAAKLDKAKMQEVDLRGAILSPTGDALEGRRQSDLPSATLRGADLTEADLRNADLQDVDFTGAMLLRADLRRTEGGETFRHAILIYADLRGSVLEGADLRGATLGGARFCRAYGLQRAKLDGAIYDATTRWPPRFNPITHGAVKVRGQRAREYAYGGIHAWVDVLDEAGTGIGSGQAPPCRRGSRVRLESVRPPRSPE